MTEPDPRSLVQIAIRRMKRGATADASAILTAALEISPADAEAWLLLGEIHRKEDRPNAAIACYARGLEAEPGRVDLTIGLANAYSNASRFGEAVAALQTLVQEFPDTPEYRHGLAMALHRSGQTEAAIAELDLALAYDPDATAIQVSRATLCLSRGQYAQGWSAFDARLKNLKDVWLPDLPIWTGGANPTKRLLVVPEGGYGDIIWAARFLPALRPFFDQVSLVLPPALRKFFANFAGVDGITKIGDAGGYDLFCPILSLPERLGVTDPSQHPPADFRLEHDPAHAPSVLARADQRLRVGIIWSGNPAYSDNRHRAAPLDVFLPLTELPGVQLFSLQKGPPRTQLSDAALGDLIIETDDFDFSETAEIAQGLDLIIMTDTAVAHLAGSLGVPVWILLDHTPHWLFGRPGSAAAWYPSIRQYRQDQPGDWAGVMKHVRRDLLELAEQHLAKTSRS